MLLSFGTTTGMIFASGAMPSSPNPVPRPAMSSAIRVP
jgi:hypothetical protein